MPGEFDLSEAAMTEGFDDIEITDGFCLTGFPWATETAATSLSVGRSIGRRGWRWHARGRWREFLGVREYEDGYGLLW